MKYQSISHHRVSESRTFINPTSGIDFSTGSNTFNATISCLFDAILSASSKSGAIKSEIIKAVHLFLIAFVRNRKGSSKIGLTALRFKIKKFPYYSQNMFSSFLRRNKFFNFIGKENNTYLVIVKNCRK